MPRSGRSRALSREEIVDEALKLTLDQGLNGLTMRAVASSLGVTPMAVYYYVEDKDDLVRAIVERVSDSWGPLQLGDDGWEESLRRHLLKMWHESSRHYGVSAHLIELPTLGVTERSVAAGLEFFEQAGFTPESAPLAWSFTMTYIHGRMSVDAHLGHRPDVPRPGGTMRARDYVDYGIDAVIAGLRSMRETEAAIGVRDDDPGLDDPGLMDGADGIFAIDGTGRAD